MKNDILPPPMPPRQPQGQSTPTQPPQTASIGPTPVVPANLSNVTPVQPTNPQDETLNKDAPQPSKNPWNKYYNLIFIILGIGLLIGSGALVWYRQALQPVASGDPERVQVVVASGSSPSEIAALLTDKRVIRNKMAFDIYVRLNDARSKLRAGSYSLSPADSTPAIVSQLTTGSAEQYDVTFYPGATLNIASTGKDKTPSHRQVLQKLGFEDHEIDEAFSASYADEYPLLFSGKPATADLEGYVYGQTYKIASGSSVKQVLRRTFAEYEKQIKENDLVALYEAQGLSLYEGITLASIIQREVPTLADQKQVAQVFLKRYRAGGTLGSDVTYHYAADKRGVDRVYTLDDPYNTRINPGLPPGPIASPGISSLLAVAAPAAGDYEFFLSGDDDKTYFATTQAEHEANIIKHCAYKCSLP